MQATRATDVARECDMESGQARRHHGAITGYGGMPG